VITRSNSTVDTESPFLGVLHVTAADVAGTEWLLTLNCTVRRSDRYRIIDVGRENQILRCPTWESADLDGKRLVWAASGKLFASEFHRGGLAGEVELHDFNDMTFEAVKAPYQFRGMPGRAAEPRCGRVRTNASSVSSA
jgi:hypothetical protein